MFKLNESSETIQFKPAISINELNHFSVSYSIKGVTYSYEAKSSNNKSISSLIITTWNTQRYISFVYDYGKRGYKFEPHIAVIKTANDILSNFTKDEIENYSKLYEVFAKSVLNEKDIVHSSPIIQSLFFHNAILNTIRRSLKENKNCECTPHPGYLLDKTPFFCTEDYYINPQEYLKAIDKSNYVKSSLDKKAYAYLQQNRDKISISIDKVLTIYESKVEYLNRVEYTRTKINNLTSNKTINENNLAGIAESDCMKGTDLGCCGNYEGCCWYSSMFCLAHDIKCYCCSKWHCGPGCKKENGCPA